MLALAASGTATAAHQLGGPGALVDTGYGRVVLAKVVGLVVLTGLGAPARRRWLPVVAARRRGAETSLRRAAAELSVMAVALGLASALAATG